MKCEDCEAELLLDNDVQDGDIISCPCCGLEYEVKYVNGLVTLKQLSIEGEDWGE